jgi:periplasmic protein TonB
MRIAIGAALFVTAFTGAAWTGAALAEPAPPATGPPDAQSVITKPIWVKGPDGWDYHWAYSKLRSTKGGQAAVSCRVTERGTLDRCTLTAEDPPGLGFGAAALQLAGYYRMRLVDRDGAPTVGRRVVLPMHFGEPPQTTNPMVM